MIKTNLDASLTATALKHGTKNFTKAKLDEELDFIGANVSTYASKEYPDFSHFATKDKDKVLTIKEVLLNPFFDLPNLKEKAGYWLLSSKRKSTICNRSLL
jgi:hypothetical protein